MRTARDVIRRQRVRFPYERRNEPLLPLAAFVGRLARHALVAGAVIFGSLGIGILGYHGLEGLSWIDALLNAAMILGGMGPVNELHTTAGKLFASFYALYAGVVFLVVAGIVFAPLWHRLVHHFHLEIASDTPTDAAGDETHQA